MCLHSMAECRMHPLLYVLVCSQADGSQVYRVVILLFFTVCLEREDLIGQCLCPVPNGNPAASDETSAQRVCFVPVFFCLSLY